MQEYLDPTPIVDSHHPDVVAFAERYAGSIEEPREAAVRLYYAVRDGIRYDPYAAGVDADSLRASSVLAAGRAWCVPKAVLLSAACRARGIPARLGFADVRNHLSTERMRRTMKTDVFYYHGYSSIHLAGRWLKATPAFNVELCEKFRLLPLEFDGTRDSLYHPFDADGRRHMEYVRDRGEFADVPLEEMRRTLRDKYPGIETMGEGADFDREVEQETGGVGIRVVALHRAPGRRLPMRAAASVRVETDLGIVGDRYHGSRHRQVTVQSASELDEAARRHGAPIDPGLTRRNVTLSGGTLERRPGHRFRIGSVELEVVRDAAPCRLLEDTLGRDARRALSRRAGVVCRVLRGGEIHVGDGATLRLEEGAPADVDGP